MLHFSCDLCGQALNDRRYVVKLEVYPAFDPEAITEEDLDADHLEEVAHLLSEDPDAEPSDLNAGCAKAFRFDLCPACHAKFAKDPLGREALRRLNFSEN